MALGDAGKWVAMTEVPVQAESVAGLEEGVIGSGSALGRVRHRRSIKHETFLRKKGRGIKIKRDKSIRLEKGSVLTEFMTNAVKGIWRSKDQGVSLCGEKVV